MKRVLTIQDISCVGRCSLTVALPILSAAGLETCVLPTAVLSAHTGFKSFTFHDLTGDIEGIEESWEKEGFRFDAIYTGFLGSAEQVRLVKEIRERFLTDDGIFVVDPAMADHGKLYPSFGPSFVDSMRELVTDCDVSIPNLTEAALLLQVPYDEKAFQERETIQKLLRGLHDLGTEVPILTGVSFDDEHLGSVAYDPKTDSFYEYFTKQEPESFHGTGDIFASAVVSALERGKGYQQVLRVATEFTHRSIEKTLQDPTPNWYGVNFEEAIPDFLQLLAE